MKHKYFVAYLLSGPAKAYHRRLTEFLSRRFHIFPLHERVVPHITVKAPFLADEEEIVAVERILRSYAHNHRPVPISISGFGHFGFRTVYLDVEKNPEAIRLVRTLLTTLSEHLPWLSRFPTEGNKLHSSIARFLTRVDKRRIFRILSGERPHFRALFDNIAILKKEGKEWKVTTVIPFSSPEHAWKSEEAGRVPAVV